MRYPLDNWEEIERSYRHGDKTWYGAIHRGVDYIVTMGTKIYAPENGEIVVSSKFFQGGNTHWFRMQNTTYGYVTMRLLHLDSLFTPGKYSEGAVIGIVGNTGSITIGPHLHLDLSKRDVILNNFNNFLEPEQYFMLRMAAYKSSQPKIQPASLVASKKIIDKRREDEFIRQWEGKFILDVDDLGKLYYVNNGTRHYMGPHETIHTFAKKFATGFTHENVLRIPE